MTSTIRIEKDFKEFLRSLISNKVNFLIVGGFAYSIYAQPRFTKDLDIFIEQSEANAEKVVAAIKDFLGETLGLATKDLLEPRTIIQLGFPPLRIDITTHCDGLEFAEAWENRFPGRYDDLEVFFLSIDDLIKNKTATGRDQDILDAKKLRQVKEASLSYGKS